MEHTITIVISICCTAISGMILFFLQRYFKQKQKQEEKAEARREKKDMLMLKSLKAIGELTVANAIAVKNGKCNGEMHKAMEDFEEVDKELNSFLIQSTVAKK